MNLFEIFEYVNYIANKEQLGDPPTPERYTLLLKDVNLEVYSSLLENFIKTLADPQNWDYSELPDSNPLKRFAKTNVIMLPTDSAGQMAKPKDYGRYISFLADTGDGRFKRVRVYDAKAFDKQIDNVLAPPLNENPIVKETGENFLFVPNNIRKISISYLRVPEEPYFDYCFDETGELVYMPEGTQVVKSGENYSLTDTNLKLILSNVMPKKYSLNFPYESQSKELDWDGKDIPLITESIINKVLMRSRELGQQPNNQK